MVVWSILNNYQIGSYTYTCLQNRIIKQERLDTHHTKVWWDLADAGEHRLLVKVLGGYESRVHKDI